MIIYVEDATAAWMCFFFDFVGRRLHMVLQASRNVALFSTLHSDSDILLACILQGTSYLRRYTRLFVRRLIRFTKNLKNKIESSAIRHCSVPAN